MTLIGSVWHFNTRHEAGTANNPVHDIPTQSFLWGAPIYDAVALNYAVVNVAGTRHGKKVMDVQICHFPDW